MFALTHEEWQAVRLSLAVAANAVAIGLPAAIVTSLLLRWRSMPGRTILNIIVHLPLVLPPVVVGWMLLVVFGIRGHVGQFLHEWFGIRLVFTAAGAALACAVMTFPLMVRAIRLSLEAVDAGLEEAAGTLGAGAVDRFFTVTLPLMTPGVISGAIMGYAASLGEFGAVITFASNVPGQTQTLPLAIFAALQTPGGEAAAARLALISIVLAVAGLLAGEWFSRWSGKRLKS
ncbi:molybdate transport system permease protein [Pseudochelatococcus lubricantis]|uniref:Molybdenum transport system permease n=1 Tax=Pseudochelatococcus lubricantis TaxID=1538102 RepID=A0ABX0V4C5_9HYPH|nr:molybdate ABC transporter permease subunit [Pseudochelatococcus lubricantis]NIJ59787.1 molybdate transport system permease protein [Pseudochelatococcus lubricantis]